MTEQALQGRNILVVEDEYLIADDMRDALTDAGAVVLGPVPTVAEAHALLDKSADLDGALLDVNLQGDLVFAVADALRGRGVPFVFTTGYDQWSLPARFSDVPRLEKPIKAYQVAGALRSLLANQTGRSADGGH